MLTFAYLSMDLYQLRYFLEVARELSFTRAASNLHVSPPAVSRSVALLERSVGRRLLARTRRRVALTADGEVLKGRAQRVFDEIERAKLDLAGAGPEGPAMLRVASREMITNYLFADVLLDFQRRFPGTRFGLYDLEPKEMAEALRKDEAEIAFYYTEIPDPGLESSLLGRLKSHVYSSKSLLRRCGRPRGVAETLGLPWIAPRYFHSDPAAPAPDGFPDQRLRRRVVFFAEFLETHRRFVIDGVAVGVLPDLVMKEALTRGRVVQLPGPPLHRDIYGFRRRGRPLHPAVDQFMSGVRRAIRRAGAGESR